MSVAKAINFRKNIRVYDGEKHVTDQAINMILEAGRLAPSSNGLEPVKVLVIKDQVLKEEVAKNCFFPGNYEKITTASALFLFLATNGDYVISDEFLRKRLQRIFQGEELEANINGIRGWIKTLPNLDMYGSEQAHITAAYMGLQAADLEIGTTTMGGILPVPGNAFLAEQKMLDPQKYHLSLGLAIGYYDETTPDVAFPRNRIDADEFYTVY